MMGSPASEIPGTNCLSLTPTPNIMKEPFSLKKFFQYSLQGLIILAPIVITIWAVTSLFNFIDRILPDLLIRFFPNTKDVYFTGLGFLVVILTRATTMNSGRLVSFTSIWDVSMPMSWEWKRSRISQKRHANWLSLSV